MSVFIATQALAVEDAIVAIVEDEVITLKDLREYIKKTYVNLVAQGMPSDKLEQMMLDLEINGLKRLIEDKLVLNRANELGLEINDKFVELRIDEIKSKFATEQDFIDAIVANGATVTDIQNKILEQLKIKYVIEHEVRSKIYINPKEITEFYNAHAAKFQRKERVNLESIYIAFNDDEVHARKKADLALKRLENNDNFKDVAKDFSDAASIGVIERGQLLPVIEDAVFNLKPGDISPLVKIETGFYIFKLIENLPSEAATLEEVKDEIYDRIFDQKFRNSLSTWIAELKEDAYIEIKE